MQDTLKAFNLAANQEYIPLQYDSITALSECYCQQLLQQQMLYCAQQPDVFCNIMQPLQQLTNCMDHLLAQLQNMNLVNSTAMFGPGGTYLPTRNTNVPKNAWNNQS
mmetsp:Transcript_3538/g.4923  ORF Transcript_3538/g.4923 Transcript_3538/m.4923 type:complete len:107 (+) Transcript_3538:1391-1711(+)